jgi:glycosyltransferase involved in cell wall biosynthesis
VAIPAFNEAPTVGDVIRAIPRRIAGVDEVDVLVIDDGSNDQTSETAVEAGAVVLRHETNRGVGAAFHSALAHALELQFDLIVTIDADGQFDPAAIPALIEPVVAGAADFTTASRFKDPNLTPAMPWTRLWGNRLMSRLISALIGRRFYDVSCGMRCYHRRAALQLYLLARFTYTQEVFLNLSFRQMRLVEVALPVRGQRRLGRSRVAANLVTYALRTTAIILRSYRDYYPLRLFGAVAALLLLLGGALGVFFLQHYLRTGAFHPHTWAAASASGALVLAVVLLQTGLIGDMLNRHRTYLEELLYRQRDATWRHGYPGQQRTADDDESLG